MGPRKTDFRKRKELILGIAVDQYIKTISPVSSGYIARTFSLELSPATIRNILAELEEDGFLMHPHTSAGRVPTQRGYRYYVDHLMNEIQLLEEEKRCIKEEYEQERLELEDLLDKTSRVISDLTHYTSIISVDGWDNKLFCQGTSFVVEYPDLQDIQKIKNILEALDEKERILEVINQSLDKRVEIFIGQEMQGCQMNNCSLAVSQYTLKGGQSGRIALLGPTAMNYERAVSALEYISDTMSEIV